MAEGYLDDAAARIDHAAHMLTEDSILAAQAIIAAAQDVEHRIKVAVDSTQDGVTVALTSGAILGGRMARRWTGGAEQINETARGMLAHVHALINDAVRLAGQIADLSSTMEGDANIIRNPGMT